MDTHASKSPKYPCMTQLMTRGTFYDVGYNVGLTFGENIKLYHAGADNIADKMIPFYKNKKTANVPKFRIKKQRSQTGRDYYQESLRVCRDCFPQYVRELRGIADGAGIPFEHIFMANLTSQTYSPLFEDWMKNQGNSPFFKAKVSTAEAPTAQDSSGCTDVFINRPGCQLIGHNEDCASMVKSCGYLLSAEIEEEGVQEQFTSFCYPGFLPGRAWNYNNHGLTVSVDTLYPKHIVKESPSRIFVTRSLLKAKDIPEIVMLAKNAPHGVANGFCANVSTKDGQMVSVEVAPGKPEGLVHVHDIRQQGDPDAICHYFHFNAYKHLIKVPELEGLLSSKVRDQRTKELPPPTTLRNALAVLGNTHGPIFRTQGVETVNTVVFDVTARQVLVYQGSKDLVNDTPLFKLPMYQ